MQTNVFAPFGLRNLIINGQGLGARAAESSGAQQMDNSVRAVVLTADNMPTLYLLRLLLPHSTNTLLIGPPGKSSHPPRPPKRATTCPPLLSRCA